MKVLLTTSGTGSRLGELTKTLNKALVEINGKPAVAYIIDRYAPETEFVVTVGYLSEQVREALTALYPNHHLTFVDVDNYEGPGSSLGYSMLCAQSELQCPFIFHCCDTIVMEEIAPPTENWIAGFQLDDVAQYRTLELKDDQVIWINDKGQGTSNYIHIGLVGVHDYAAFWTTLDEVYWADVNDQALNDTFVINPMLKAGSTFHFIPTKTWYDTGNPSALARTVEALH